MFVCARVQYTASRSYESGPQHCKLSAGSSAAVLREVLFETCRAVNDVNSNVGGTSTAGWPRTRSTYSAGADLAICFT